MKVKKLKELIADLPDDMDVVYRVDSSLGRKIVGIHVRPYDARNNAIWEDTDVGVEAQEPKRALILNGPPQSRAVATLRGPRPEEDQKAQL